MRHTLRILVPVLLLAGCADQAASPMAEANASSAQVGQGRIVHKVSVGGPDICPAFGAHPGCDANLSLIAIQREDGSVSGQWNDSYGGGYSMHANVDCLLVQVIPGRTTLEAWIGGVITSPDLAGHRVIMRVRDNGTSMNDPLPDALSRAIVDPETDAINPVSSNCQDKGLIGLARTPQGQVTIW
jgi:hypothetical protein